MESTVRVHEKLHEAPHARYSIARERPSLSTQATFRALLKAFTDKLTLP